LAAPRILLAMSRDGLFFAQAAEVNAGGTPAVALGVSTGVASLFLLSASFETVINVLTFFIVSNYGLLFVSLFVLRWREPTLVRPYRAWGFPWTTALALVCSITYLLGAVKADPLKSLYALLLLAASIPAFLLQQWLARPRPGTKGPAVHD